MEKRWEFKFFRVEGQQYTYIESIIEHTFIIFATKNQETKYFLIFSPCITPKKW